MVSFMVISLQQYYYPWGQCKSIPRANKNFLILQSKYMAADDLAMQGAMILTPFFQNVHVSASGGYGENATLKNTRTHGKFFLLPPVALYLF